VEFLPAWHQREKETIHENRGERKRARETFGSEEMSVCVCVSSAQKRREEEKSQSKKQSLERATNRSAKKRRRRGKQPEQEAKA
jgi:hypothetical protein